MRLAKKFFSAREHFGETSTFELSVSCLIFAMRYQKLNSRLNHARITQESYKPIGPQDKWVPDKWVPYKWAPGQMDPGQLSPGQIGPAQKEVGSN